ncbi:hypothetical protein [Streptomyces sp. NPDC001135]
METLLIIAAAVLWGCGTGVLIPRLAYRLSVPSMNLAVGVPNARARRA